MYIYIYTIYMPDVCECLRYTYILEMCLMYVYVCVRNIHMCAQTIYNMYALFVGTLMIYLYMYIYIYMCVCDILMQQQQQHR